MRMDWRLKGIVQKTLSLRPGGTKVNDLLQRTVGELKEFEGNVDRKVVNDWAFLVSQMSRIGITPGGLCYVEVGCGWYPTLPLCYFLAGAKGCTTLDLVPHISEK